VILTRQEITLKDAEDQKEVKHQLKTFTKLTTHTCPYHFTLSGSAATIHFMYTLDSAENTSSHDHISTLIKNVKQRCAEIELVFEDLVEMWCDREAINKAVQSATKITSVPFGVKPPSVKKPTNDSPSTASTGSSPATTPVNAPEVLSKSSKEAIGENGEMVHLALSRPKKQQGKKGKKPATKKPIVIPMEKKEEITSHVEPQPVEQVTIEANVPATEQPAQKQEAPDAPKEEKGEENVEEEGKNTSTEHVQQVHAPVELIVEEEKGTVPVVEENKIEEPAKENISEVHVPVELVQENQTVE
jgi:hypothetical protein